MFNVHMPTIHRRKRFSNRFRFEEIHIQPNTAHENVELKYERSRKKEKSQRTKLEHDIHHIIISA